MTIIMPCTCKHSYQDSKYGRGKRVFNLLLKEGSYRCTICNKER